MMWIVFVMCLTGGDLCRDVSGGRTENGQTCLMDALPRAVKWADEHPGYDLLSIRCQSEEPVEGQDL